MSQSPRFPYQSTDPGRSTLPPGRRRCHHRAFVGFGRHAVQAELIRLRRLAYVSEKKLSAEVSTRMRVEEM